MLSPFRAHVCLPDRPAGSFIVNSTRVLSLVPRLTCASLKASMEGKINDEKGADEIKKARLPERSTETGTDRLKSLFTIRLT